MSEKIYALLLRLYPAAFRQRYGAEALQLLRDRLRDEKGLLRRLRLGADLLADFAAGLPQAYRNSYVASTAVSQGVSGAPAFAMLEEEPLRPGSVVVGSALAVAAVAAFIFVMNHAAAYHPFSGPNDLKAAAPPSVTADVEQAAEKLEQKNRAVAAQQACSFEKFERHPGNIGYVKLSFFPNPADCHDVTEAVMEKLNTTDAIVFDLRDNRGGYPEMVRYVASWLFDRPAPWYNPRATSRTEEVTDSPVSGSELANKPVFILTSARTFSGGEHFVYNLKMLKRATIVGETTSGASHGPAGSRPIQMGASERKPAWEGTGVPPDVAVRSEDALQVAEKLALRGRQN